MEPDFDTLVSRLDGRLLPEMAALAAELRASCPRFRYETFSNRHADGIHSLGLSCAAPGHDPPAEDDSCGIVVNVFDLSGPSARGFVWWNRTYRYDRTSRARVYEYMTPVRTPESPGGGVEALLGDAPSLYRALRRAVRRGRPPGPVRRGWYRLLRRTD